MGAKHSHARTMNSMEVKQARSMLGLSQRAFAKEIGVSYVTVARWETDRFKPSKLAVRNIEILLTAREMVVQGLKESAEGKAKTPAEWQEEQHEFAEMGIKIAHEVLPEWEE